MKNMIRMLLDIFIYQQNRLSWPLHRLNIFQMKFCIGGVDCQPYHEILYQKYIFFTNHADDDKDAKDLRL